MNKIFEQTGRLFNKKIFLPGQFFLGYLLWADKNRLQEHREQDRAQSEAKCEGSLPKEVSYCLH